VGNWWDYPPSPVVGVSPSASPQYGVSFHEDWLPHVMGLLEKLHDEDYFTGSSEELETNYRYVVELLSRIEPYVSPTYASAAFIPVPLFRPQGSLIRWAYNQQSSQWQSGCFYQTVGAQNDFWSMNVPLAAGDYTYRLWGIKSVNLGKTKLRFNGVWQEASLFDWYAAAATYNVRSPELSVTFAQGGLQEISLLVPEKNAASSGFYVLLNGLWLNAVLSSP